MKKDKKNSFNTPDGYFDSFHERLMAKINNEEVGKMESLIPKSDGFSVPKGYFDGLAEKVLSQVGQHETKVISLKAYRKFYYGAAAIAAVFLLVFGITWKKEAPVSFENLASNEIDAYFETNEVDMSTYEIAEVVSFDEIELNNVFTHEVGEENILEYLSESVEDIEELNLDYSNYE
ncbi:MAG: hypothetical protein R2819_00920 [Allomuricauda sp.]